ncbi:VWA domain-containing protein [Pseudomonas sp. RP23018S]|uniref:VWA domain-containing protein n=1 Tax=Pseudomonas sp. RP23018S TaxID=3096037 RepID=UPI002ACAF400|nr:VWA domain-containing protein [Pseudomonas sp. RP23018S]MDZ5602253.1 VWA domain-containing protein [Pseudomonas sp. RP23018S]
MTELWPYWLRPLWLLALPLLGWLLLKLWRRRQRAGRWQMILPVQFHATLLGGGSGSNRKLAWIALGVAWLLVLLALLGPSWQRVEHTHQRPADPLVILLELTPAMLAEDSAPNRLEQARRKILDLLEQRRDSQTALIVYAGSAHTLVPLSDDLATTRNLLEALDPSLMPQPGQRADLAVRKALGLLAQSDLGQGRLLLVGSSLSEHERSAIERALGRHGPSLLMLGIGSSEGAPVRQANGEYLKDEHGAILLPRLDSPSLKRFINDTGGRYRHARLDDLDLRGLGLFDNPLRLRSDGQTVQLDSWLDQGYWLLLPLLLLAACAGRRGWLFCLPLLLALPQPSQAFELRDLWLRPDQQGRQLLEQHQPAQAARRFADPQWRGMALYQAGDFEGAAKAFAESDSAEAHYNRGNALAASGELDAALDAYEQALDRQSDLQPALANQALVEEALAQRTAGAQAQPNAGGDAEGAPGSDSDGDSGSAGTPLPDGPGNEARPGEAQPGQRKPSGQAPGANASGQDEDLPNAPARPGAGNLDAEQRQALEQWLREIPDNPAQLLRRKFWYEQQLHQEKTP